MKDINHLVVLMMENRSFDHVLGALTLQGRNDIDGITKPFKSNPGPSGSVEQWGITKGYSYRYDVPHDIDAVAMQYADGKMDGFVMAMHKHGTGDAKVPMGYYDENTFPVLYALAKKFTVCDRWFSSVLSSTWPNRKYFHSGTCDADDDTQLLPAFPGFNTTPIYEAIEQTEDIDHPNHRLTWKSYVSDMPFLAFWYKFAFAHLSNFASILDFARDCAAGTLPHVSVVDPPFQIAEDHPPHNPMLGEKFIGLVVDALTTSQSWHDTALLIVYDEHGGFYDHVLPENLKVQDQWKGATYGFRVPAIIVSPYSGGRTCLHDTFDHTSFMKSIHERWGVEFPEILYGPRWKQANSIWTACEGQDALGQGLYTGVEREDVVAALNWATGIYERLSDEPRRFEHLLERIFVLPELKALDRRAALFDTLNAFEHHVVTQKRMYSASVQKKT